MKYKGLLARRRSYRQPPGVLATKDDWRLWREVGWNERAKVFAALCDAHKVAPNDGIALLS
ncbi:MAG TPA: hypothetical protein VGL25_15375, partial [Casimicrobiaceae bacterium]